MDIILIFFFFFSSRRRHTRSLCDWSSDVCSSDLSMSRARLEPVAAPAKPAPCMHDSGTIHDRYESVGKPCRPVRRPKIGRASCREREESAVGAGGVKKKRKQNKRGESS